MSITHRPIPILPERPCAHPLNGHQLSRSYTVGRLSPTRICQDQPLVLTITTHDPLTPDMQARLLTNMDSSARNEWSAVPFTRVGERMLECRVTPSQTGLSSFRAEFSRDGGTTWVRDTVPDAWVLVDPPQIDGLRLYTLIPTISGTISDWKVSLKHVRSMGFNAIHLLPITTLDTSESPYSARDLFSVDHGYLPAKAQGDGLAELESFIAEAKQLGIRLCFDLVLNHVGVNSLMAQRAPDWIVPDEHQADGLHRARFWTGQNWHNWEDLVLVNYEHPSEATRAEIWAYMTEYALFWAKYANDTGGLVRFDNLHSSAPDFVQTLSQALQAEYPQVAILAEYFTDEGTLLKTVPQWNLNLILATPWDQKFVPQLREYLRYLHHVSEHVRYFMPITSHDSGSPAQEFGSADSTIPRYVAAALLGTGATGITQGVEYGESERVNFIGRKPKYDYPAEARYGDCLRQINSLLAAHPAFRRGGNCQFLDNGHPAIIAAFRSDVERENLGFLVVCNFDIQNEQRIALDLAPVLKSDGPFAAIELLGDDTQTFPYRQFELCLPPCSAQVWQFSIG